MVNIDGVCIDLALSSRKTSSSLKAVKTSGDGIVEDPTMPKLFFFMHSDLDQHSSVDFSESEVLSMGDR